MQSRIWAFSLAAYLLICSAHATLGQGAGMASVTTGFAKIEGDIYGDAQLARSEDYGGFTITLAGGKLKHPIKIKPNANGHYTIDGISASCEYSLLIVHAHYESIAIKDICLSAGQCIEFEHFVSRKA